MDWEKLRTLDCGCLEQEYQFLYGLVALLRPSVIVEIGTGHGGSSIIMASALKENNINGKVMSIDINANISEESKKRAKEFGVEGYIDYIVGDRQALSSVKHIDLAFIDGDHFDGCQKDWDAVKEVVDVAVFHDTHTSYVPFTIRGIGRNFDVTVFKYSGMQYICGRERPATNWQLAIVTRRWNLT